MDHSDNDDALSADFTSMRGSQSPDFAPREPSSDYLRQKLRERRLGVDDRPLRSLSLSHHKPIATMDDYIFANEDATKKDRRRSRPSGLRRASLQPNGSVTQNSNPAMASKEVQATMDKLINENFDLKLRLRLMEQKNHRLEEQLEHEQEKTERLAEVAAERDDLDEENADLCARVEELQESVATTEQKLLDSWKMNSEVIRELEKRDADIKEALDMYLDAENRLQALEQKYAACKLRRDSSYFSNDADAVSISKPVDSPSTPKRAPSKPPSGDSPLSRKQRSASTPIRNGQHLSGRYHKLVRTVSVSEIRTNELRRQASVVAIAENEEPPPASTPETRPRGLRRFSATPQYDQMSVSSYKTSSSERSRGLRMAFLQGEQNDDTDSSPSTKPWSASVSPHSRTPRQIKDGSRQIPTPSSWSTSHSRANDDIESVASSDLPVPSEKSVEDDTTTIHEEPQPEDDVSTPTLTIPTEYYPGHYPKWPGTPGKHFRASNLLFDGNGIGEMPRMRHK